MKIYQNKTVVLTGAGAGMGKEAALLFAGDGANVVVNLLRYLHGKPVIRFKIWVVMQFLSRET